jgi:uncharacterized protein (DUF1697 family)
MPTHVALLRGINVGGGGKLPMADLRQVVTSLGHSDVVTYIQSGNVVFTASAADSTDLANELRAAIASATGLDTPVVLVTRKELADIIGANPYKDHPDLRYVHVVFLPVELAESAHNQIRQAEADARDQGGNDEATLLGRALYLHTPNGFGTSELSKALLAKRKSPVAGGTARNLNTVTKLLALCDS